jgi:thymidine kinase
MFTEPNHINANAGWIEVVCGSMFSGKTEELIRRLKRARIANQKVGIYKPEMDVRYAADSIVSHDENTIAAFPVKHALAILNNYQKFDVIGVDEAQFFGKELIEVCQQMADQGKRVIIAGLDMDYTGKPFGPMPELLSIANYVTKLHAICVKCGGIASYSFRTTLNKAQVVIGEKDHYEARCRSCFNS